MRGQFNKQAAQLLFSFPKDKCHFCGEYNLEVAYHYTRIDKIEVEKIKLWQNILYFTNQK